VSDLTALRLRGWAHTPAAGALVRTELGDAATAREVRCDLGMWSVADPLAPAEPVGPARSLLWFAPAEPAEVEFVPGSQGCGPPAGDAGGAVVRVALEPPRGLVLDARCWFRIVRGAGAGCTLSIRLPRAAHG
jgi:hypothetical protein